MIKKILIILVVIVLGFIGYYFKPYIHEAFIFQQIERQVNTEADSISQCRAIAYGARACGGPEGYLVYSNLNTNENKLEDLISKYTSLQIERNKKDTVSSICSVELEPELFLENGNCLGKGNLTPN